MCYIGQPIYNISNTKIICIKNGDEQITIYSNCIYNNYDNNVMIIPVPNPETVSFISLDSMNELLLEEIINDSNDENYVDNYYTKLYNNIDELLNDADFSLSNKCINELMNYSGSTTNNKSNKLWGFIVCKLNKGNIKYLPFAYKHKMISNHLYIPTRAYYKIESIYYYFVDNYNNYYWNHNISLINTKENILLNSIATNITSKKLNLPVNLAFNNILNLKNNINIESYIIKGYQLNIDFYIYN